ncbi:MAG: ABC transporter permease [Planctomycetes bacterium]|nr:ABC transporter permease [Planctomycetota bacterium]
MRTPVLVAIREYLENIRTKGFWIGVMLFPVLILIAVQAPRFLEKATPVRALVLVDQSGLFEEAIEQVLARDFTKRRSIAFARYFEKHLAPGSTYARKRDRHKERSLEEVPASALNPARAEELMDTLEDFSPQMLDLLGTEAAWRQQLAAADRFLAPHRPAFVNPEPRFRRVPLPSGLDPGAPAAELVQGLRPYLLGEHKLAGSGKDRELFAAVIIPPRVREPKLLAVLGGGAGPAAGGIEYWSTNLADSDLSSLIERAVNEEYRRLEYEKQGLDAATVRKVQKAHLPFQTMSPRKAAGKEEVSAADVIRQYAPIAFVYLLFIGIFTISQMLLNNTIEEKSNRIIEVLLSSVTAGELMMGKLLGIAAIGLTMIGAWIAALFAVLALHRGPEAEFVDQALGVLVTSNLLPLFAVYFLLGYLFYAGIFLAIGSICNTLKEAQNFMGPMLMLMMVPLVTMFFIPKDPNGTLATVLSWIPFYTPFVMMNRAAADPPLFDQVGTIVLMVLSTALVLWLAGKVFRTGILRTGQPPRLLEVVRWLKGPA